jgi:hypothetical protein
LTVLRPIDVTRGARAFAVLGSLAVAAFMLLPMFQGAESRFGLTDKEAHALAFYLFTVVGFLALPRSRRTDMALAAIAIGGAAEIAQLLTGRDASWGDLAADSFGVFLAWGPAQAERLRKLARTSPFVTFKALREEDRRKDRRKVKAPAPKAGFGAKV